MQDIEFNILIPALLAGLLVTATHVPLGIQVLRRGIVFIDIAIAQIAGVGVIAADFFGLQSGGYAVQISALTRGAGWRAVHDVDGATLARHSGRHHRHRVRARGDAAGAAARRQSSMPVNTSRTCWSARSCGSTTRSSARSRLLTAVVLAAWFGLGARAPRADGLLSAVRSVGDRVGTDRRRVPGVFDADHSGARDTSSGSTSHREGLRSRRDRLPDRTQSYRCSPICRPAR